ncbi:hypothetical protein ACFOZ0_25610 [Streptomyces yaanensis]|uniref:GerMN domain-containing protein n=1 Tax=Streptomyces yaanensis TaxID=1142239 RepID=A0ABV7SJB6_9ACTN|nr:hypothetical protein [Streptomyces sp. CGMCC 4.7035]WNC01563.1 hypothetical protein Q2K21_27820 [Streptomyces sp. CGMCC 4.7035]
MTPPRRAVTAVRRAALLFLPALYALTSCGIPTTGVVEAGGPASGVVPTIRVYFVLDGALVGRPRQTVAPVDVESALKVLLLGPNDAERTKGVTTRLPLPTGMWDWSAPATGGATAVPPENHSTDLVKVTTRDDGISVELTPWPGEFSNLAAAQIICTATAAQRVAAPAAEPAPVTVTGPDGRHVEGTAVRCPDDQALGAG